MYCVALWSWWDTVSFHYVLLCKRNNNETSETVKPLAVLEELGKFPVHLVVEYGPVIVRDVVVGVWIITLGSVRQCWDPDSS